MGLLLCKGQMKFIHLFIIMAKKAKKKSIDKYQLVADQLLSLLKEGTKPWTRGWATTPYCNALTGHRYSGLNPVLAETSLMTYGYSTTLFVGYGQAKDLGLQIIKGSKATWLRVGGVGEKEETDSNTGETRKKSYRFGTWVKVFNLDCFTDEDADVQIAELIARYQGEPNTAPRIVDAEALIEAQQAEIVIGGNRACYAPKLDQIHMPPYESFRSAESYYATLIHELGHRTGHQSRLARDLSGGKGSDEYAFEELVAELTAAFVCSVLNIEPALENHASYLASWMKLIKADNKVFFRAYGQAQAAADLLLETAGMQLETAAEGE